MACAPQSNLNQCNFSFSSPPLLKGRVDFPVNTRSLLLVFIKLLTLPPALPVLYAGQGRNPKVLISHGSGTATKVKSLFRRSSIFVGESFAFAQNFDY
jgi:hypothetical protein